MENGRISRLPEHASHATVCNMNFLKSMLIKNGHVGGIL